MAAPRRVTGLVYYTLPDDLFDGTYSPLDITTILQ
jgi:hypothetical protein